MVMEQIVKVVWEFFIMIFKMLWILLKALLDRAAYDQVEVVNMPDDSNKKEPESKAKEIERFYELKEKGILTSQEFEEQKKRVLK